jgi:small subunit ribosomal protein S4
VNIPSYRCREGDLIELRDKAKDAGLVLEASQSPERQVPDYIEVDHNKMTAKLTRIPTLSDVPYPTIMEPNLVIEFYSR